MGGRGRVRDAGIGEEGHGKRGVERSEFKEWMEPRKEEREGGKGGRKRGAGRY